MPLLTKEYLKLSIKPEAARLLTEISRLLAAGNIRAYIVGGFVRDAALERDTDDIDIAVDADALVVARDIASSLSAKYVPLDPINLIGRVVIPGSQCHIDFSSLKGDIEQDLARRDFTINAMAYELDDHITYGITHSGIIDPFGGIQDLHHGLLKALNDDIFAADPARLLRAVRIAAELDLDIDAATITLISLNSRLVTSVAGERIREELMRLLALPGAGLRIFQLDKLGLLSALMPELNPAKGVDQPHAHVWDVFEHSLQTVGAVEFVLGEATWDYASEDIRSMIPWSERIERHFNRRISSVSSGCSLLKLAALLHDIAKPQTKTMDGDRARFLGHQEEGAEIAAGIMERLRFSNREIKLVELLIKNHLRPTQMSHSGLPTSRAIYRFFRDTGEAGIDVLYLSLADHLAARGPALDPDEFREHARMTAYVLEKHFEEAGPSSPPKLIDGSDIMTTLGLPPGPVIGELLENLREAQAAGEVENRAQALMFVERLFTERYNNERNQSTWSEK
jgi:poly(A) polymerase